MTVNMQKHINRYRYLEVSAILRNENKHLKTDRIFKIISNKQRDLLLSSADCKIWLLYLYFLYYFAIRFLEIIKDKAYVS